jgi:hypothetical protein
VKHPLSKEDREELATFRANWRHTKGTYAWLLGVIDAYDRAWTGLAESQRIRLLEAELATLRERNRTGAMTPPDLDDDHEPPAL